MEIGERLRAARVNIGLSSRDVARLADVPASTVTRIENGSWQTASYDLVLRLLEIVGYGPDLMPICRPSAIAAARFLLGDKGIERPADQDTWIDRWRTLRLLDDDNQVVHPRGLAYDAGLSAKLNYRPDAVNLERNLAWIEVGERLNDANISWANTGDSAANRLAVRSSQVWPVFYVESTRAAVDALNIPVRLPGEYGPRITLIPFDGASETGRWLDETGDTAGMWFAAPWQVVMDNYGGKQRMPVQAEWVLDSWGVAS